MTQMVDKGLRDTFRDITYRVAIAGCPCEGGNLFVVMKGLASANMLSTTFNTDVFLFQIVVFVQGTSGALAQTDCCQIAWNCESTQDYHSGT
jgi:hypothetical protein